jgi:hypothetical protein
MPRTCLAALFALVVCAGGLLADELKGKVKSADADKSTLTVVIDGKEKTFDVAKDTRIFKVSGTAKRPKVEDVEGGLKGLEADTPVAFFTETKNGKEVVTQIKVDSATLPVKKKKNKP